MYNWLLNALFKCSASLVDPVHLLHLTCYLYIFMNE